MTEWKGKRNAGFEFYTYLKMVRVDGIDKFTKFDFIVF